MDAVIKRRNSLYIYMGENLANRRQTSQRELKMHAVVALILQKRESKLQSRRLGLTEQIQAAALKMLHLWRDGGNGPEPLLTTSFQWGTLLPGLPMPGQTRGLGSSHFCCPECKTWLSDANLSQHCLFIPNAGNRVCGHGYRVRANAGHAMSAENMEKRDR